VTRTAWRAALAVGVALLLLGWMTRGVSWSQLAAGLHHAPWWAWSATVLGLCASYLFRALRIRAELRARLPVGVAPCLELMLVHNAAVNVVPLRGGEAAYPYLMHHRLGVPVPHALASLVWMRVQDVIVLAFVAAALWPGLADGVRIAAAGGLAAAVLFGLHALERVASRGDPARHRTAPLRALHGALQALALAPRHGWEGWVWCVSSWGVKIVALGSLLGALAGGASFIDGCTGALGGELAGVLPIQGPAGLGTYEAGVWGATALRGFTAARIAAPALAVHLLSLATAVAAGAVAHATSRRRAAPPALEHDHA
jgi:uncharacterized membrane protein YbhN (UPF0104 family)